MPRQGRPVSLRAAAPASVVDVGVEAPARDALVVPWPVLGWMLALVDGQDPGVAVGVVTVAAAWVMWLTLAPPRMEAGAGGRPGHGSRSDRRRGPGSVAGDDLPVTATLT